MVFANIQIWLINSINNSNKFTSESRFCKNYLFFKCFTLYFLYNCFQINKDKEIENTLTRNSNIPEELGRISYILSDKTGTLT